MIDRRTLAQLDPERLHAFCEGITQGLTRGQLAAVLGVTPQAVEDWLSKGQKDVEAGVASLEAGIVVEAQRASARMQEAALRAIQSAIVPHRKVITETTTIRGVPIEKLREELVPGDWQAAAWLLERSNPTQWGRRQVLAHLQADGGQTYKRIMLDGPAPLDAPTMGGERLDSGPVREVPGGSSTTNGLTHLSLASSEAPLDSGPSASDPLLDSDPSSSFASDDA